MLILNKKSIAGQESQLFESELEKFRPHQNRLLQANHKQATLMKELTKTYGDLLQDKRVRAEQSKYESITRRRNTVMARYKKVYEAFNDLLSGTAQAQTFYSEMSETVGSLKKNVESFINNRRAEGAQLLSQIEREKASGAAEQEDRERERLRQLMERLSTEQRPPSSTGPSKAKSPPPALVKTSGGYQGSTKSPTMSSPHYPPAPPSVQQSIPLTSHSPAPYGQYMGPAASTVSYVPGQPFQQGAATPLSEGYNPMAYPYQTPVSPPPPPPQTQQYFSQTPTPYTGYSAGTASIAAAPTASFIPPGYIPPPPPPRPQQITYPPSTGPYPSGPGGYAQSRPYGTSQHHKAQSQSQPPPPPPPSNDPWAGLSAWK